MHPQARQRNLFSVLLMAEKLLFLLPAGVSDGNVPVLHRCGKGNQCFGLAEVLKLVDKVIQLFGGLKSCFDQHGVIPGYAAALDDIADLLNIRIKLLLLVRLYLQIDKGLDVVAELPVVHLRVIAADHAGLFHLFNAGRGGRGRKEYLSCDFLDGSPPCLHKYLYDFFIYLVQFHRIVLLFV